MENDSDSDVEFVGQYRLDKPLQPTSEYHDLTFGPDEDWDVFIQMYHPGDSDVDIKPVIKMEPTNN